MCKMKSFALIILLAIIFLYGLGQTVVIDFDEGVYAEISREMLTDQQMIVPLLNGEDFFDKPPMIYWAQVAGYKMFGTTTTGARIFNALAGVATVLIIYFMSIPALGKRLAGRAALITASSFLFVYLTRIAMTDMFLTLYMTLCLLTSWYAVEQVIKGEGRGTRLFWLACLFSALAMLTKGIIGILFPLLTALIYLVTIKRLRLLFRASWLIPGALILIIIGFSWYLMLGFTHPEGFAFMKELFLKHHLGRFSSAMEGHSGPIFYYVLVLLVGMLPWFPYIGQAFIAAPVRDSQKPSSRFIRMFLIYSVIVLLFFSFAATKLPNYILPAVPGFAILIAALLEKNEVSLSHWAIISGWISGLFFALLGGVFVALPIILSTLPDRLGKHALKAPVLAEPVALGVTPWLAGLLLVACGIFIIVITRKKKSEQLFSTLLSCALVLNFIMIFMILPTFDRLMNRPLVNLAEQAAALTPADGKILLYKISKRPSANFYSGLYTLAIKEKQFAHLPELAEQNAIKVGITTRYYLNQLQERGIPVHELASDTGYVLFDFPAE